MTHQWNTGRFYTDKGQRIVAKQEGQCLIFSDLDRGINGSIHLAHLGQPLDKYDIEKLVMVNYDHNNYGYSRTTLEWRPT